METLEGIINGCEAYASIDTDEHRAEVMHALCQQARRELRQLHAQLMGLSLTNDLLRTIGPTLREDGVCYD